MRRVRALLDPVIDILGGLGVYTYGIFGWLVSQLDYISQVLVVFMFTVYTVLKAKEDPTAVSNYGYFLAGYFVGVQGGAIFST